MIDRLKSLKFLDGKWITEEERRTSSKLEKRAFERRLEAEKLIQKETILCNIEKEWESSKSELFVYPSSSQIAQSKYNSKSNSISTLKTNIKFSSQKFDGGFYQLNNGQLQL